MVSKRYGSQVANLKFRSQLGEEDEARQQDEDAGRRESGGVECHGAVLERSAPNDADDASRSPAV